MTPILDIRGLTKKFGQTEIIRGIDLAVNEGERVAVIGPNGAGKSTLLRALIGLHPIEDGAIVVEDGRPTRLDRERTMARIREKVPGWRGKLAALGSRAVFGPGCPCCG